MGDIFYSAHAGASPQPSGSGMGEPLLEHTAGEPHRLRGKGQLAFEQMKREIETRTRPPLEVARERWAKLPLRSESEMSELLETELSRYPTLQHGWDGYSAKPASPNSLRDARKFLSMRPADVPLPYPGLDTEGEVELYWKTGGLSAAVMFEGDGRLYFYVRRFSDGKEISVEMGEDLPVDSDWPGALVGPLREL